MAGFRREGHILMITLYWQYYDTEKFTLFLNHDIQYKPAPTGLAYIAPGF